MQITLSQSPCCSVDPSLRHSQLRWACGHGGTVRWCVPAWDGVTLVTLATAALHRSDWPRHRHDVTRMWNWDCNDESCGDVNDHQWCWNSAIWSQNYLRNITEIIMYPWIYITKHNITGKHSFVIYWTNSKTLPTARRRGALQMLLFHLCLVNVDIGTFIFIFVLLT